MRLEVFWEDSDDNPFDPQTGTACTVVDPSGVAVDYNARTSPAVIRDAQGQYHVDIPAPILSGTWTYGWLGIGAIQSYIEDTFYIKPTAVPLPT
jgi:hypothetical protein